MRFWLIWFLLLTACSGGKVITYSHPNAEFDRYRTFKIASHAKIAELSPKGLAAYQRFDEMITEQLTSRGYQYALDADLLVEYKISAGLSQDTRSNYYNRYNWYYPDYGYYADRRQQVEGMLEIQLKDIKKKRNVWTGSADITLRTRSQDQEELIRKHILEIFRRFTYQAPP